MPTIITRVKHKGQVISRKLFEIEYADIRDLKKFKWYSSDIEFAMDSIGNVLVKYASMKKEDCDKCIERVITTGKSIFVDIDCDRVEVDYEP